VGVELGASVGVGAGVLEQATVENSAVSITIIESLRIFTLMSLAELFDLLDDFFGTLDRWQCEIRSGAGDRTGSVDEWGLCGIGHRNWRRRCGSFAVISGAGDVAAGDSEPQARARGSTAIIKIAINDHLVRRRAELICFVRPSRYVSE